MSTRTAPPVPQLENAVLIPRERIYPSPENAREFFDETQLKELRDSIAAHGILQPLVVRFEPSRYDGRSFKLIAGERRFRASEGILAQLPCILSEAGADTAKVLSLIENLQRADLTALEQAKGLKDLMTSQNLSARRAARALGVSDGWVNNRLSLLKTKPDVQEVAARAPLAMSSLLLIDTITDKAARAELLEQVEAGAPHSSIKTQVEQIQANRDRQKASMKSPDQSTSERGNAFSQGFTPNMSRGKRVIGTGAKEAQQAIDDALQAISHKLDTIESFSGFAKDSYKAKTLPTVRALQKRLGEVLR